MAGVPRTVVLVDDTPDVRSLVRMALERGGDFRVVAEAGDGSEGVAVAQEQQPDVVILDIAMPVMDGLEALPRIQEACPGTTVIMLSGFGDRMLVRALEAGADGYLQKGMPISVLLSRVRELADAGPGAGLGRQQQVDPGVRREGDAEDRPDGPLIRLGQVVGGIWRGLGVRPLAV